MPAGLNWALMSLGVMSLFGALAQYSMKDYFGERVAEILRRQGQLKLASKWNAERGARATDIGVRIYVGIGLVLIVAGVVVTLVG